MASIETDLENLVAALAVQATAQLCREGEELVQGLTQGDGPSVDLATILARVSDLKASILDQFCEAIPNAKPGVHDPGVTVRRRRKQRRQQAELATATVVLSPKEEDEPVFIFQPKDRWDLAAREIYPGMLLLPGPKAQARDLLDRSLSAAVDYVLGQAQKCCGLHIAPAVPKGEETQMPHGKGDSWLLQGPDGKRHTAVSPATAQLYLGIGARQREKLAKRGVLATVGTGHRKQITVESLIRYLPPKENTH